MGMAEAVKVVVRCRPINATEIADGRKQIVEVVPSRGEVVLTDPNSPGPDNVKRFTFDKTFAYDVSDYMANLRFHYIYGKNATIEHETVESFAVHTTGSVRWGCKCTGRCRPTGLQRHNLRVRTDGYWQDIYYGGAICCN